MQELAERLTTLGQLPSSHRVRRTAPLPEWLTSVLEKAKEMGKAWYHVYLDNFCAMEKVAHETETFGGAEFHQALERSWAEAGVLSAAKKRVSGASSTQELGAYFAGQEGTMGPSGERLLKLIQTTLLVISKPVLRRKWIQVVAGRWIHCMSFRRPSMVLLDRIWDFIS